MGIWRTTHDRHILISVFATGRAKSVALNARFHLLRTVVANPLIALRAWRRLHEGAIGRFPAIGYFRGLTAGRVGLVLLICTILTVRQVSPCVFQVGCSLPDGRTLSGFLLFLARQFVFALPMLLAVTVADNMTRSRQRVRILVLSMAVLLGAVVYGLAFFYTQPGNVIKAATGREGLFILAYSSRALLWQPRDRNTVFVRA